MAVPQQAEHEPRSSEERKRIDNEASRSEMARTAKLITREPRRALPDSPDEHMWRKNRTCVEVAVGDGEWHRSRTATVGWLEHQEREPPPHRGSEQTVVQCVAEQSQRIACG